MTNPSGDRRADPATVADAAESVPSPARIVGGPCWPERDRRQSDDSALAPQNCYPGRITTP